MSGIRLRLKRASGWFAAGNEIQRALSLLSDSAFKLFLWLCLHADRTHGRIEADIGQMACALGKAESEIYDSLEELLEKRVCCKRRNREIEITDCFWPYEREEEPDSLDNAGEYLQQIQQVLGPRACVQCAFTAADQKLALEFHRKGIPVEHVKRAILLGCLRKQVTVLNRGAATPITTLHYFTPVLEEIEQLEISPDYWSYVAHKLEYLERQSCDSK